MNGPSPASEASSRAAGLPATIALFGVGLIGGSLGAALKAAGYSGTIVGCGRDAARLEQAHRAGLLDVGTTDPGEAAARSDLLVFCLPVDRLVPGIRDVLPRCRPGTRITDAGSVKRIVCDALGPRPAPGVAFVGSHPLAGSEKQGFEHAVPDLYRDRVVVTTPDKDADEADVCAVESLWQAVGARVVRMPAVEHDEVLARTSHVPHVAAAALAAALRESDRPFAATGFRDATRIASGDPDLWTAILLSNADAVLAGLDRCVAGLDEFRAALRSGDATATRDLLRAAKESRDATFSKR